MKQRSITFLLFGPILCPGGGMKIILEYANRLVGDGYEVNIVYPAIINWRDKSFIEKVKSVYHYFLHEKRGWKCRRWFDLDNRVKEFHTWSLSYNQIPKSDIYIATEARTAPYVAKYPIGNERKFYFIQGYEDWVMPESKLRATYHLPLNKIVIADWLGKIIRKEEGEDCVIVKNAFDFNYFKFVTPIEKRDRFTIGTLYNTSSSKDIKTAFKAIEIVKSRFPLLKVLLFGTKPKPENLPDWCEYYSRPSQEIHNMIYNKCAIFIGSSKVEGWGLTIGEAMMCGAAIACTANNGYMEMAKHMQNALLSPVGDSEALAENIIKLIEDDKLRYSLANNGVKSMKQFSWENSFTSMKKALDLETFINPI